MAHVCPRISILMLCAQDWVGLGVYVWLGVGVCEFWSPVRVVRSSPSFGEDHVVVSSNHRSVQVVLGQVPAGVGWGKVGATKTTIDHVFAGREHRWELRLRTHYGSERKITSAIPRTYSASTVMPTSARSAEISSSRAAAVASPSSKMNFRVFF